MTKFDKYMGMEVPEEGHSDLTVEEMKAKLRVRVQAFTVKLLADENSLDEEEIMKMAERIAVREFGGDLGKALNKMMKETIGRENAE